MYSIFFVNKYSAVTTTNDYTFFSELPKLSHNPTGSPIYSNIIKSTTLRRNESWSFGIADNVFAWCGISDRKLASGAKPEVSMAKLATLGSESAPGTTLKLLNEAGRPKFSSGPQLSANAGSCAIESGSDFGFNNNFVIGLATTDDEGSLRPLTTITAAPNATVNMVPSSKFYLAAHSSSVGTVVDTTVISKHAASIDFAKHTGKYGAIVTHEASGGFSVKYTTQADFNREIEFASVVSPTIPERSATITTDPRDAEIASLRDQVQQMQTLLAAALKRDIANSTSSITLSDQLAAPVSAAVRSGTPSVTEVKTAVDPYPAKPLTTWYKATLPLRNAPGQSRRRDIRDRLISHMQSRGYTYEGGSVDNILIATLSHLAGSYGNWHSVGKAIEDWKEACESLPRHLKSYAGSLDELNVVRTTESKGLERASSETESRVNDQSTNLTTEKRANGHRRTASPATSTKPHVNGINGVQGTRNDSFHTNGASTKTVMNGINGVNGVNGVHHHATPAKPVTNGAVTNGVEPVNTSNVVNSKYDYKRAPESSIEAAKRRARTVLRAEGLEELAVGWSVSGRDSAP